MAVGGGGTWIWLVGLDTLGERKQELAFSVNIHCNHF